MAEVTPVRSLDERARTYNNHDADIAQTYYDLIDHMVAKGPIHWSEACGGYWVITGYEEVLQAARDHESFSAASGTSEPGTYKPFMWKPLEMDPPENAPWRRLMAPYFNKPRAEELLTPMHAVADDLIDGFIETGRVEVLKDFGFPLEYYGFFRLFMNFNQEQMDFSVHALHTAMYSDDEGERTQGWVDLAKFLNDLWDEREGTPPDGGLIDSIRTAIIDGERISRKDFEGWGSMMLAGGTSPTPKALGNLFILLAQDDELRRAARGNPDIIYKAIDEVVRYQPPATGSGRTVTKDMVVGGQQLRKGETVLLSWSGANRDSALCPHADTFDPMREATRHVGFGGGAHRCIGEHHARAMMFAAVERMLDRIPDFHLDPTEQVVWLHGMTRGPRAVHLNFTPASKRA